MEIVLMIEMTKMTTIDNYRPLSVPLELIITAFFHRSSALPSLKAATRPATNRKSLSLLNENKIN